MQKKTRRIIGWILSGLVMLFMLFGAVMKFTPGYHEQFVKMAPGYAATPDWIFAIVIFVSVALFYVPKTQVVGFALISSYLGGAAALSWNAGGLLLAVPIFVLLIVLWIGEALLRPSLLHASSD